MPRRPLPNFAQTWRNIRIVAGRIGLRSVVGQRYSLDCVSVEVINKNIGEAVQVTGNQVGSGAFEANQSSIQRYARIDAVSIPL